MLLTAMAAAKRGMAIIRRRLSCSWLSLKLSAIIRRVTRRAPSPVLMGRMTTPIMTRMEPTLPIQDSEIVWMASAGAFPLAVAAPRASGEP